LEESREQPLFAMVMVNRPSAIGSASIGWNCLTDACQTVLEYVNRKDLNLNRLIVVGINLIR
jgi:hypothetical protein